MLSIYAAVIPPSDSAQTDFLSGFDTSPASDQRFSEVCNALYERELMYLSQHGPKQVSLFQRRLAGLSHHIKRAARHLTDNAAPIDVDFHNGSWQAKQAAKSPANRQQIESTASWYSVNAKPGLVVPVRITELDHDYIELDSIDRIQPDTETLHLNKNGWFNYAGQPEIPREENTASAQLLKPTKPIMAAACCGHTWNHKGKVAPRALTLRELLLSTNIDWKKFILLPSN